MAARRDDSPEVALLLGFVRLTLAPSGEDDPTADFARAMETDPWWPEAYLYEGKRLLVRGEYSRAAIQADRALFLRPDCEQALQLRAASRICAGQLVVARADLSSVLAMDPGCVEATHDLALAEFRLGNPQEAINRLAPTLAAHEDSVPCLYLMAQLRADTGQPGAALDLLEKALDTSIAKQEYCCAIGEDGEYAEGEKVLERTYREFALHRRRVEEDPMLAPVRALPDFERRVRQRLR